MLGLFSSDCRVYDKLETTLLDKHYGAFFHYFFIIEVRTFGVCGIFCHFCCCSISYHVIFLEDLLSSISLKNELHFCLCFFRFSLKIIEVAKSSGMERMQNIFQFCNPWFSTQILLPDRKTMDILSEQYNIHVSCPQALSKEAK